MTTIQLRRGTAAQWTAANPVLAAGEPGLETDTGYLKMGDGATDWNSLPYDQPSPSLVRASSGPAPGTSGWKALPQDAAYVLSVVGSGVGAINTKTGNTDYSVSSGDQAPVVQSAVNNLLSQSGPTGGLGGKIVFDGHLQFQTQLVLYPNIAFSGAGMHGYGTGSNNYGSLITSSFDGPCILVTNDARSSTFVALSRFLLYGSGENSGLSGQHGIVWQPGSAGSVLDSILEQVGVFHMGGDGYQLNGATTGNQLKVLAEQCYCEFCGGNAVTLAGRVALWWSGGYVLGGARGGAFVALPGAGGILSVSGGEIGASGTGIVPAESGYTAIINNSMFSAGDAAIRPTRTPRLLVANNRFTSCPKGAVILPSVMDDVSIVHNMLESTGSPSTPQLTVTSVSSLSHNVLVEGNNFVDTRGAGAVVNHVTLPATRLNVAVTGNGFRGQQGDAIAWPSDPASRRLIKSNRGYNDAKGRIGTPFAQGSPSGTIGAGGTTATPLASTTYVADGTDVMLNVPGELECQSRSPTRRATPSSRGPRPTAGCCHWATRSTSGRSARPLRSTPE